MPLAILKTILSNGSISVLALKLMLLFSITSSLFPNADKAKIRLMCNIMIDAYVKLAPSVITDQELVQKAANYQDGFEKLLEKVNN